MGNTTIEINNGGLVNNGTYSKGTETVTFSGTVANLIGGNSNTQINNLTVTNNGGITSQFELLTLKNLTVAANCSFTIDAGKAVTVSEALTNNASATGLVMKSTSSGTGSLIINGSVFGSATAERWMSSGKWNMVASPLPGQTVASFLAANIDIATKDVTSRGMMDYNPVGNSWNGFFTNATPGILATGKGFAMRVGASAAALTFTGTAIAGDQVVAGLSAGNWNCIGNPYTSAIHINSNSNTDNFLTLNGITNTTIDPAYGIYMCEKPDASNGQASQYTVISNVSDAYKVQQGQAFFVKMKASETSINFAPALQTHLPLLALKSAEKQWPTIQLEVLGNGLKSNAVIAFNSSMTYGLDPTYDAGLLKGNSELAVYTSLVEDYGIPFSIQALPDNDFTNLVIPVGLDSKPGGEVIFSTLLTNLPVGCEVILEDKTLNKFVNLATNTYAVKVEANSKLTDRFYIHTSSISTNVGNTANSLNKLNVYAVKNSEIRIEGNIGEKAVAVLYDIQGRKLLVKNLGAGNINIIGIPNLKNGIYMLQINENNRVFGYKIPVRE